MTDTEQTIEEQVPEETPGAGGTGTHPPGGAATPEGQGAASLLGGDDDGGVVVEAAK